MTAIIALIVSRILSMPSPPHGPQLVEWTPPPGVSQCTAQLLASAVEDGCWVHQRRWVILEVKEAP